MDGDGDGLNITCVQCDPSPVMERKDYGNEGVSEITPISNIGDRCY